MFNTFDTHRQCYRSGDLPLSLNFGGIPPGETFGLEFIRANQSCFKPFGNLLRNYTELFRKTF